MSMTFEQAATPLQLVLDGNEDDPKVELVDNLTGKIPLSFETSDKWIPRLGSAAMLSLASTLHAHGAELMAFDIRDLRLERINVNDSERLSGELIDAIKAGGLAKAESEFNRLFRDYLIYGFEVLIDRRRATVAREGVVFTSNKAGFLQTLRNVWQEASSA